MRTSPSKRNQLYSNQKRLKTPRSKEKTIQQQQRDQVIYHMNLSRNTPSSKRLKCIKAYHFSNCIYQGVMNSFHRTGRGLLLHDNGLTGIINSGSNRLKDHNIFLGQNIIISAIYKPTEIQFVYKNDQKILVLTMQRKNNEFVIRSPGYMIELDYALVFRMKFKSNRLIQKVSLGLDETKEIIDQQRFDKIMGLKHIEALKFNFYDKQSPFISVIPKPNNQLHIGFASVPYQMYSSTYHQSYSSQNEKLKLHGLGLIVQKIIFDPSKQFHYGFRILSRGFYSQGQPQYFGEIYYDNGNHYFGKIQDQQMHGNGMMIYEKQKRFVYGEFAQGQPLRLDQDRAFRLDTQEGKAIYMACRKKLHSQDPEVWIDNEVKDQPSPQYFLNQLRECINFRYEDEQLSNLAKRQRELKLSRKLQDFQHQDQDPIFYRSPTGRLSNTLYDRSSYLNSRYILQLSRRQQEQQLRQREKQIQEIRRSRSKNKAEMYQKQAQRLTELKIRQSRKRDEELDLTPIKKINDNYQMSNTNNGLNNKQINQTIINNLTFSADPNNNSSSSGNRLSASLINEMSQPQKFAPHIEKNYGLSNFQQKQQMDQSFISDSFNINVHSPIERSLHQRSHSRSQSKSLSRRSQSEQRQKSGSKSKSGSRQKITYLEPQEKIFKNSPTKRGEKRSIIQKLYRDANLRAQKLEKEYQMLQETTRNTNSPYKNVYSYPSAYSQYSSSPQKHKIQRISPSKNNDKLTYLERRNLEEKLMKSFVNEQQEIKRLEAAAASLRLANLNKVKEQKYLQYDHFTMKKRFDYTSDINDEMNKKYEITSYQPAYKKTPQESNYLDRSPMLDSQRTLKKQKIESVVNRLYPHNQSDVGSSYQRDLPPRRAFDSSYQRSMPLNRDGRTKEYERTINFGEQTAAKYIPNTAFKSSVIKQNVVVRS